MTILGVKTPNFGALIMKMQLLSKARPQARQASDSTHPKREFRKRLTADIIRLSPAMLCQFAGQFGTKMIWGIYVPPEAFAILALFFVIQNHSRAFITGWIQNAAIRFLPDNTDLLPKFFRFSFVTIMVAGLVGLIASLLVYAWFFQKNENLKFVYFFLAVMLFVVSAFFNVIQTFLRGRFETKLFTKSFIISEGVKILLLIILLKNSEDHISMVLLALTISYIPGLSMQLGAFRKEIRLRSVITLKPDICMNDPLLIRSIKYGFPLSLSLFLLNLSLTGDRYLLVNLVSLKSLGIYVFWMGIGMQIVQGFNRVLFMALGPRLFQVNNTNTSLAQYYVQQCTSFYILLGFPLIILLGTFVKPVFDLIQINPGYAPGAHLIYYSMGSGFFLGLAQLSGKKREFAEKTWSFVNASLTAIAVMAVALILLTHHAGLTGAASAVLLGSVIYFTIIASVSRSWPRFGHCCIGIAIGFGLFYVQQFLTGKTGFLISMPILAMLFAFYTFWIIRILTISNNRGKTLA